MSIKIKFIIIGVVSLMTTIIAGIFLYQNNIIIGREVEKEKISSEIQDDLFNRGILRDEYFLYGDQRPLVQLQFVTRDLSQLLSQASGMFTSANDKSSIALLISNKNFIDDSLSQIIAHPLPALQQQLTDQILIKSQDNNNVAEQLEQESRIKVGEDQQAALFSILIFIAGLFLAIITTLYFIWQQIGKPLFNLKEHVERIASLDFTTTTTNDKLSNDEIGSLAKTFNNMAAKIKESYFSLKNFNIATQNILEDLEEEKAKTETAIMRLDLATKSANIGVWDWDIIKNNIAWDDNMFKLYGINRKANTIAYNVWQDGLYPEDMKETVKLLNDAIAGKAEYNTKFRVVWPDKSVHYLRAFGAVVKDENGKPVNMIGVNFDITNETLIDREKTEFVSLASHQLRTPLTAINWYTEMLKSNEVGKLNKKQKNYLSEINNGSVRMVRLVSDLLNVSRIETGRLKIEPKKLYLNELIDNIIRELDPMARKYSCKLVFNKPKKQLPKISVDETLMRQIIQNLITNAIRYSPAKLCEVIIGLKQDEDSYLVTVADQGIGIPKEAQHKIFEKFFRADNARVKEAEGSGIGLYIAKMIVETSGGKIWFKSPTFEKNKVSGGTTFYLSLPATGMKAHDGERGLAV